MRICFYLLAPPLLLGKCTLFVEAALGETLDDVQADEEISITNDAPDDIANNSGYMLPEDGTEPNFELHSSIPSGWIHIHNTRYNRDLDTTGEDVHTNKRNNGDYQRWQLDPSGDGYYYIKSKKFPGKCVIMDKVNDPHQEIPYYKVEAHRCLDDKKRKWKLADKEPKDDWEHCYKLESKKYPGHFMKAFEKGPVEGKLRSSNALRWCFTN